MTPKTTKDWLKIVKLQENMHVHEMTKWQEVIQGTIELLKKVKNNDYFDSSTHLLFF